MNSNQPLRRSKLFPLALTAAALASLLARPAAAENRSYKLCDIVNGQVFSCGSWYQGKAVVNKDGAFRECDIVNGQVFSCGSWYQGKAAVNKDGAFRECDIVNGQAFSCGSWYQGKAVVYTSR